MRDFAPIVKSYQDILRPVGRDVASQAHPFDWKVSAGARCASSLRRRWMVRLQEDAIGSVTT